MRHKQKRLSLNRFTSWRKATLRSLAQSLIIHQSIKTTKVKAMAVKPLAERLITLAKSNTLAARRQAYRILGDHKLVSKLFRDIGQRFANNKGGYTRIINIGNRRGDNAELVILELTQLIKKIKVRPKKEKEIQPEGPQKAAPAAEEPKEKSAEEKKPKAQVEVAEKPPISKKPTKKFLGGIRNIFKKERRDSQ